MIANKHITKIVAVIMAVAVCLCLCAMVFSDELAAAAGGTGVSMEYESELFDTSEIITVNIIMDDDEWETMLANATSEEYYQCDVEVNGKMFYNVAIRPKGNTSLTSIASDPNTDRYSLKLEFDQFVEGQTCFGLDKLVLNNNYADATNMKEALIYDMYQYLGADASLYNYAEISVNGGYWGVYLALEAVEDSFLLRNYGVESGELYKPDSMDIGVGMGDGDRGEMPEEFGASQFEGKMPEGFDPSQFGGEMPEGFDASQFGGMTPLGSGSSENADSTDGSGSGSDTPPSAEGRPDMGDFDKSNFGGGFSMGGSGSNLNYTDDDLDSYSTIWDSEVTGTSKSDHERVVKALKNISEGTDLEKYMDVDNLLKYMAVHVFSVNDDSLTGSMAHNYYLYEYDGQLNILPWDYNLAFGGMGSGSDATSTVNDAIDGAFSGTKFFDTLMENEEYKAQYHAYLQQLVDEYINGGGFEAFYTRTRGQISSLVETDPTAFYTYDEYTAAVEILCEVVELRGASIDGQIDGSIPSTASEQRNSDALIDASHLDISVMGTMNVGGSMGGGFGLGGRGQREPNASGEGTTGDDTANATGTVSSGTGASITLLAESSDSRSGSGGAQPGGTMPEGFDPSQFGGEPPENIEGTQPAVTMPEDIDPSQFGGGLPEGVDPSQFGGQAPGSTTSSNENETADGNAAGKSSDDTTPAAGGSTEDSQSNEQRFDPSSMGFGSYGSSGDSQIKNLITYGICFAVLIAALVFAMLYRRKPRRRR